MATMLIATAFVTALVLIAVFRLFLHFVLRAVQKKYGIQLSFNRCYMLQLSDIKIEKEGKFCIEIESIKLQSSLFSNEVRKPITILFGPTNVVIEVSGKDENSYQNVQQIPVSTAKGKPFVVPDRLTTWTALVLQFVGININGFTAVIKKNDLLGVVSANVKAQISKDSSSLPGSSSTDLSLVLSDVEAKLLYEDLPLFEVSCMVAVTACLRPRHMLSSSEFRVQLSKLKSVCNENLVKSLTKIKTVPKPVIKDVGEVQQRVQASHSGVSRLLNIPQFEIILEDCKATFLSSDCRELSICWHCSLSWKKTLPELQEGPGNSYSANLDITGLVLNGGPNEKYMLIKQITTEAEITRERTQMACEFNVNFDTLHVNYSKEEIDYWLLQMSGVSTPITEPSEINFAPKKTRGTAELLSQLSQDLTVKSKVTIKNCSCDFLQDKRHNARTRLSMATFCIGEIETNLDVTNQDEPGRKSARGLLCVKDVYCYVYVKDVVSDCSLESFLPCIAYDDKPAILPSSEQHVWGRVFEFGSSFLEVKCENFVPGSMPNLISINGQASYITIEVSCGMILSLLEVYKSLGLHTRDKRRRLLPTANTTHYEESAFKDVSIDAEVRITSLNAFVLGQREDGLNSLLAKVDSVDVATGRLAEPMMWEASGFKVVRLSGIRKGRPYFCCGAKFLSPHIADIPSISACFFRTAKPQSLNVSIPETTVDWTPTTHMVLKEIVEDCLIAKDSVKDLLVKRTDAVIPESNIETDTKAVQRNWKFDVISFALNMKTSDENSFGIALKNFAFCSTGMGINLLSSEIDVFFDKRRIFHFEEAEVKKMPLNQLQDRRQAYGNLKAINPRVWGVSVHSFVAHFPYKFDFATSLEKVQNVFKMLKYLHKKPQASAEPEPLPPDLLIHCENLTVEFEDDPFEVKLGHNYMLQMDENEQCIQREAKLKERIGEITSTQGTFFSSQRYDEILRSLKEKNAQIYVNRSKMMYENGIPKTPVFRCVMRGLELTVMADPSMHGFENVVNKMKVVNRESPIPNDIKFTTLWCRVMEGSFRFFTAVIKDYQQPFVTIETFKVTGLMIGAEQTGINGASRSAVITVDDPWTNITVQKNMSPLKFYYDLEFGMNSFDVAWGVNFEAAWAMASQSFELLSKPTIDKSVPLPFWDKCRLLFHGHLKMKIDEWNILLSASRNPYNTTEKMVIAWQNAEYDWTNAKMVIDGDFDLHTRTASKYDDSQVLHLPNMNITIDLEWLCEGNPNDHHNVSPRNPAKLDDKVKWDDSFHGFRSKNLNLNVAIDSSRQSSKEDLKNNPPSLYLYASTFRWFQKYQAVVIGNVSRPIRRGILFKNVRPRKQTLGRHYKLINIDFSFPKLRVNYWGSFTKESGFDINSGAGSIGISYHVFVSNVVDEKNLIRRPLAQWIITSFRSEVDRVITSLLYESFQPSINREDATSDSRDMEENKLNGKHFFFSVKRVRYNRQSPSSELSSYTHRISLTDFRGAWTDVNRQIIFGLFEAYTKMQMLKRVLSSDALKAKLPKSHEFRRQHKGSVLESSPSPMSRMQSGQGAKLLRQLLSDQENKFVAEVEEGEQESDASSVAEEDDIIQYNWHIELVNSQVMLRGIETKGVILLTSANTEILKRLHRPVAVNSDVANKLNKVTWSGKLENLQYFSTSEDLKEFSASTIPWITTSIIAGNQERGEENDVSSYLQSGDSVGGTVNVMVKGLPIQLQRVISRCGCDFYYLSLDPELDTVAEEYEPTEALSATAIGGTSSSLANHLQVRHPTLEISTSPAQFEMFMDITQNLLLYTESKKKEEQERLDKMKFKLQLYTEQDLRGQIQELQTSVRSLVSTIRRYERELYEVQQKENSLSGLDDDSTVVFLNELSETKLDLQEQIDVTKDQLYADSEDLAIVIRAYKDVQKMRLSAPSPTKDKSKTYIIKQIDVLFDDMKWRLTQKDGQLGIADVQFRKFCYNKLNFSDNSCEHRLELGSFTVANLLPGDTYKCILSPHEVNLRRRVDKSVFLRVYCCVKAPVAGISVKEHFEVNVCPIAVRLTYRFYHELEAFFFRHKSTSTEGTEVTDFDLGVRAREEVDKEETKSKDDPDGTAGSFKVPPPRPPPPPPRPPPPRGSSFRRASTSSTISHVSTDSISVDLSGEKSKKRSGLTIPISSPKEVSSPPVTPSSSTPGTPSKASSIKKGASFYRAFSSDESIDKMKERASKNQTFIYVKVPEIPICFSYKGEKERNIEDAHDFNLCVPTLEYHNRTWTWRDLLNGIKKDYTQVLVPQIIKEKLRLKGGWENKPSMAQADDEDKAKLLFGEKQGGTQKKAGKKLLFGKLSSLVSGSKSQEPPVTPRVQEKFSTEKSSDLDGKGIEPGTLQETFDKLRTMSKEEV